MPFPHKNKEMLKVLKSQPSTEKGPSLWAGLSLWRTREVEVEAVSLCVGVFLSKEIEIVGRVGQPAGWAGCRDPVEQIQNALDPLF